MRPAASVSGLYFAHAAARYFTVGPIGVDQVRAYAARKGLSVDEVERWLGPNLAYESRRGGSARTRPDAVPSGSEPSSAGS
jgi:5-methyltetrahydrofolate--homocysteine methyltransferase